MTTAPIVLHLLTTSAWQSTPAAQPVTNASLDTEGFIHCTDTHEVLLRVANAFYRSVPDAFTVLHVDTSALTSTCVWEAPAHLAATDDDMAPRFPHIYGPIDREAIVAEQSVLRDEDGSFVGYADLRPVAAAEPNG